jgi:hypothetical protein
MTIRHALGMASAVSLMATPALAAPANPAASLSLAPSARAGSTSSHKSDLLGGAGLFAVVIVAGVAAIVAVAVSNNDNDNPTSP